MKLPRLAIEQYQFTLVMIILLTLLGVASYFSMPRSEDPQFDFPTASVVAVYPGANPEDVEQLVVDPLEKAINELEDIKKIETTIEDGVAVLFIQFLSQKDPDDVYSEVVDAVSDTRDELPTALARLDVIKESPNNVNILQVALVSESASYAQLQQHADRLERFLERTPGVKRVKTWAIPEEEVRVSLDLERMRELGLTIGHVMIAIAAGDSNIPGGDIVSGGRKFNLKTSGNYSSLESIRRTVIIAENSRLVYLKDIAAIEKGYEDASYLARYNGQPAAFLTVTQRSGSNIFDVMEGLQSAMLAFAPQLSEDIRLETVFDQTFSVERRLNGFFVNLLQGILLVGFVVLLALGARASFIVMIAVPVSIFIALGMVDFSGFGLQQMTIVGFVIALGLLVDNAIVVAENAERYLSKGLTPYEASLKGAQQVGWAIVSSTVTTVLAFLPMVLLGSTTGDFIRSMPVTVIFTLAASLLISLTLTPFLSSRLLKTRKNTVRKPVQEALDRFAHGPYRRVLHAALRRPITVLVVAGSIFVGSLALFPLVGVSLFPKAEKQQILINVDLPEGASLSRTDEYARLVEQTLDGRDGVVRYATNIGRGNPRIYYNAFPKNESATHAQLLVELEDRGMKWMAKFTKQLRSEFASIPGARIEVEEFAQGPPVAAPIAISVAGDNLDVLRRLSSEIESILRTTIGATGVDNPSQRFRTDLQVQISREKAALLGVPLVEVDRTVRAGIAGIPAGTYRDSDGEEFEIVVRLPLDGRASPDALDRISVASRQGSTIPLRQIAEIRFTSSATSIKHLNRERVATITADVLPGFNVAETTGAVVHQLASLTLPSGYRVIIEGEQESREESFGGMGQALLIALLGIFGILVLQFKSFSQPFIVFTAIPFAITGAVLALLVAGYTFSFTAFVGLTSLVGIVVNNSIILVDYANQRLRKACSIFEAILAAGEIRFKPIVLTTLTTIGGLLPLTLSGSSMWTPLGLAIIGGLLVSTVLTLFVVPALYTLLTPSVKDTA